MAEYTYDDIIINPTSDRAKEAVGKEVYYDDSPSRTLFYSNKDRKTGILVKINEHKMCPFLVEYEDDIFGHGCIIVKKEENNG